MRIIYPDTQRMNDLLALSHVPRWGIVPLARQQSVADHSFRVAVIAMELAMRLHNANPDPPPLRDILLWSLVHDGAEAVTGDIPGHIKSSNPGLRNALYSIERQYAPWLLDATPLLGPVRWIVKVADLMESISFIWMNKGHSVHAEEVWRYLSGKLEGYVNDSGHFGIDPDLVHTVVTAMLVEIEGEDGRCLTPISVSGAAPAAPAGQDSK